MDEKCEENTKQQILCLETDMKCKVVEFCIINCESRREEREREKEHAIKNGTVSTCSHMILCAYCSMVLHGSRGALLHWGGGGGRRETKEIFV
jgi:hypothetical protein